jgi:pimeloyl-[acyl-carrier protein] synthase
VTDYPFFSMETLADPYPVFDRLREEDPVHETNFGYWYVSRYDDANRMLRDAALGAGRGVPDSMGITSGPLYDLMTTWMMAIDGPAHTRVRRLISRAFTPRAVEAMRPSIQAIADRLLDEIAPRGSADIVADYAFPLPMEVVRLLFGVEPEPWAANVTALFDPATADPHAGPLGPMGALAEWFVGVVEDRRRSPGADMFSAMLAPDEDGDALSTEELVANAVLLVTAGFETTMSLVTLAVYSLLTHPDQLAVLLADPARARDAIEETLRFEPAALSTTRSTSLDYEVGGVTIPGGANVLFSVVAANRDPRRYDDPGRFDITRTDVRPLTFGAGQHACIGAPLARLEGEIAIASLFDRFPGLRLPRQDLVWQTENPTVRRPVSLRVEWDVPAPV